MNNDTVNDDAKINASCAGNQKVDSKRNGKYWEPDAARVSSDSGISCPSPLSSPRTSRSSLCDDNLEKEPDGDLIQTFPEELTRNGFTSSAHEGYDGHNSRITECAKVVQNQACGIRGAENACCFPSCIDPSINQDNVNGRDHVNCQRDITCVHAEHTGVLVIGNDNHITVHNPIHNNPDMHQGCQLEQKIEIRWQSEKPFPEKEVLELINGAKFKRKFETKMVFETGPVELTYAHQGCIALVLKVRNKQTRIKLEEVIKSGKMTELLSELLAEKFGSVDVNIAGPLKVVKLPGDGCDRHLSRKEDEYQIVRIANDNIKGQEEKYFDDEGYSSITSPLSYNCHD